MNKDKKFHIQTFGCQMNERDSETLAGILGEKGFSSTADKEEADIAILNTCSIRENADKRFFGTLGQLKKQKGEREDFIVCVCGCMMQQQHIVDTLKAKYPWVDIVFGTLNIHEFPMLLENVLREKKKQFKLWDEHGEIIEHLPVKRAFKHKGLVNIMFGCNNFCTYCIVPYTRSRERSRAPEDIIQETRILVAGGAKEVTLLGQNVNSYKGGDTDFTDLIYRLEAIEGLERIRFMTSHPKDISDKLIEAFDRCEKLSNYIHLPVQSGSNHVLKKMNRSYTREDYLKIVDKLRKKVPEIAISTDIIVGFPQETEDDFQDTLDLVKEVEYDSAFTFMYSIRKGTPAEKFPGQIPEDVKHERFNRLLEVVNKSSYKKNKAYEGRVEKVLVDGFSKKKEGVLNGRTESFKLVDFYGGKEDIGKIVSVEITRGKTFSLFGNQI